MGCRIPFLVYAVFVLVLPSAAFCLDTVIGVKAGSGYFSYTGEDYQDFLEINNRPNKRKWGFVGGAFVTIELTDYFAIQPELLVVAAGDAYRDDTSFWDAFFGDTYIGGVTYNDQVLYAVIPVLLKTGFWRLGFFAGPTLFLRLGNGRLRLQADDETLQWDLESTGLDSMEYADGEFSRFAFAVTAGTGIEFPAGRREGVFLLEARGHYVFTNVLDESLGLEYQAYGLMVMAGYGIGSGGRKQIRNRIR
jgi:hypothetical protein